MMAAATNIIIRLTQEGWDAEKINEFIIFIETHRPSEEEAMNILKSQQPRCKSKASKLATLQSSGVLDPRGTRQMSKLTFG